MTVTRGVWSQENANKISLLDFIRECDILVQIWACVWEVYVFHLLYVAAGRVRPAGFEFDTGAVIQHLAGPAPDLLAERVLIEHFLLAMVWNENRSFTCTQSTCDRISARSSHRVHLKKKTWTTTFYWAWGKMCDRTHSAKILSTRTSKSPLDRKDLTEPLIQLLLKSHHKNHLPELPFSKLR